MSRFKGQKIAMLGSEGSGMHGLATLLAAAGGTIVGIDRRPQSPGVTSEEEARPLVADADLIVYSDALPVDHPLLLYAHTLGIPRMVYHEVVGELSRTRRTVAVTGTHGKSSTTAMLAHIFEVAGLDPTVLIGAAVPAWNGQHARAGSGDYFIVEADEYRDHFLSLTVESAIITSIDFDHPDFFASRQAVVESFLKFIQGIAAPGAVFIPKSVEQQYPIVAQVPTVRPVSMPPTAIEVVLPGEHMQQNAWLAISLAIHYGIQEAVARAALCTFAGLHRRFELLGEVNGMTIITDYGHHPTEIAATLRAARRRFGDQRLCAVFEAHTSERLERFGEEFAKALALADGVVLAPPFLPPGRSENERQASGEHLDRLAERLTAAGKDIERLSDLTALGTLLRALAPRYAVALTFSAGNLDHALRTAVSRV